MSFSRGAGEARALSLETGGDAHAVLSDLWTVGAKPEMAGK